ncbi:MAG: hypothetical protein P4L36_17195 [Holophaga sp.]|nr:hypothetical protein [Holophaga sp.]
MTPHLNRLYEHLAWADNLLLDALERAGGTSQPVLRLLSHVFGAEHLWLIRIRKGDTSSRSAWPQLSLPQCRTIAEETHAGFREIVETSTEGDLATLIPYRTTKGQPMETSLEDILLQVRHDSACFMLIMCIAFHLVQGGLDLRVVGVEL